MLQLLLEYVADNFIWSSHVVRVLTSLLYCHGDVVSVIEEKSSSRYPNITELLLGDYINLYHAGPDHDDLCKQFGSRLDAT